MNLLTVENGIEWCSSRSVACVQREPLVTLRLQQSFGEPTTISLPVQALDLAGISYVLTQMEGFSTPKEFMLFLVDWNMWSEQIDAIGGSIFNNIRSNANNPGSWNEAPSHVCEISQLPDLQAMLFTVFAFGWDAYLIPDTGECLIEVNHDGWLRGWATSPTGFDALKLMLQPWPLIQNQ